MAYYKMQMAQYRTQLQGQIYQSYQDIDNIVLIVATGALVISISLLENFTSILDIWLVGISWSFLLLTLIILTASHGFSIKCLEKQVDLVDEDNAEGKNKWRKYVTFTNWASRILLIIGIFCLACYAFSNLKINPKNKKEQVTQSKEADNEPQAPEKTSHQKPQKRRAVKTPQNHHLNRHLNLNPKTKLNYPSTIFQPLS